MLAKWRIVLQNLEETGTSSLISWNALEDEFVGSSEWLRANCSTPSKLRGYLLWSSPPPAMSYIKFCQKSPTVSFSSNLLEKSSTLHVWGHILYKQQRLPLTITFCRLMFKMAAEGTVSRLFLLLFCTSLGAFFSKIKKRLFSWGIYL